jgi:virulence-associated protein VagC
MNVAKVIQSGSSQAIRLPDEFRVDVKGFRHECHIKGNC